MPPSVNDKRRRGRGVPEVAAAASEVNGYRVVVGGAEVVTGGTSAVAPLWGAFIALVNEQRGHTLDFINPVLYQGPAPLRPITSGNDKPKSSDVGYVAGPGWNACTGLSTPNSNAIITALTAVA